MLRFSCSIDRQVPSQANARGNLPVGLDETSKIRCWTGETHSSFSFEFSRSSMMASIVSMTRRSCIRSEEHTSELQSLMRISYAVFCLKKKKHKRLQTHKY